MIRQEKTLINWLKVEPAAVGSAIAALYAAMVMAVRAYHGEAPLDPDVLVAAAAALWGLFVRAKVTPTVRLRPHPRVVRDRPDR